MFYGATPALFEKAKQLRQTMTESEVVLWNELKSGNLGVRFKAQHPIKNFIADFYCHKERLVIEIDGSIHTIEENREYDEGRTFELNELGITVIRFTNEEIKNNLNGVLEKIKAELSIYPQTP